MDEFGKRLKRDAAAIRAKVPPELRARIDASLVGVTPVHSAGRRPEAAKLWWASSLTGVAAAALVIAFVNWRSHGPETAPVDVAQGVTVPEHAGLAVPPALEFRTADFVSPLENELDRLRSDIEKARESLRKDLDFTF
ncbi:MAG: hypothetical protein OEW59_05870 [Gammaproteobacteria bacterium]|nr:hypothetical protein [Gammaproteobacteria bacterium]